MTRPKNHLVGILVTDPFHAFRFARVVGFADPVRCLRKCQSYCPLPVRFEMLVEGTADTYRTLRARLTRSPGVHLTLTKLNSWFVYNEPFIEVVNQWCVDMEARKLVQPSLLAKAWIGVMLTEVSKELPPGTFEAPTVANDS